jgi:DNA-binding beta-propeller fold protein YncE
MTRAKVTIRRFGMVVPTVILPLALSACGSSSSTPGDSSDPSTHPTGPAYSYVSNGSGLISFNLVNHSIGRPIAPGTPSGFRAITIAPGGRLAYVIGTGGIERLDLATGAFSRPISTMTGWQSISLDATSQTLYLAGGNGFNSIVPVSIKTGIAGQPIPVPGTPAGIKVSPDGGTAYVITQGGATLTPVDLTTDVLGPNISVPDGVSKLAIVPDGRTAYATGSTNDAVGNHTFSYVTPIDLTTGVAGVPIALLNAPQGIVLTPNGQTAYVTGGTYPSGAVGPPIPPDVTSIDLASGRVAATFSIPGGVSGIVNATS